MSIARSRRSTRGRGNKAGSQAKRSADGFEQLPFGTITLPHQPFQVIDDDQLEMIHQASLSILSRTGVNFLNPRAQQILKQNGVDIDASSRARFDPEMVTETIKTAPSTFTVHARNPTRNLSFGANQLNITPVSGPPNVSDLERGRRSGNWQDYCDFLRLAQSLNVVHFTAGHPVEPIDIPVPIRHYDATRAMITLTDKIYRAYALGEERILDTLEMARIARGVSEEQFAQEPSIVTIVNANSPLQYDIPMLGGMIEMASRNQPIVITPFTLAGAMAPTTLAGALAQQNAEFLAGAVFSQLVNPGAPIIYGGFTSNVDMKTGSPAFGTPENCKSMMIGAQLARRYQVPYRSSNVTASNAPDGQAVYESMMSLWAAFMGHTNMLHQGLGWLEGGLCASFEKMIMDAEMIQHMIEFSKPLTVNADTLALDAINDIGPGGHFFGHEHTLERFEHAFYSPMISDWSNFETWQDKGSLRAVERANKLKNKLLAEYKEPDFEQDRLEELDAFIAKRKEQGGAKAD
jgi:trimethylamine--corrinoid protein Co-methyltransferase